MQEGEKSTEQLIVCIGIELNVQVRILSGDAPPRVDADDRPVAGGWVHSTVVRDGIVVDWLGATTAVRNLTQDLEARLGYEFTAASASIPPGVGGATATIDQIRQWARTAPAEVTP